MNLKVLIYYLLGYVNISVEGFFIEKFMNICISKKIFFWSTKRIKSTMLLANISVSNFREIVNIAKKCQCKIKINKKRGLPFLLNRYRKRKIFVITLAFVVIGIIYISNFIWNIEVIRNRCSQAK